MLAGAVIGWIRGGRLSGLAHLAPRWIPVLAAGVALVAAARAPVLPVGLAGMFVVAGYALALAGLAANLRIRWLSVAFLGAALNTLVIAANRGRMPVSPAVLRQVSAGPLLGGTAGPFYVLAGPHTALGFLGDGVPAVIAGVGVILSPGDVLLAVGVAGTVQAGMLLRSAAAPRASPRHNGDRRLRP